MFIIRFAFYRYFSSQVHCNYHTRVLLNKRTLQATLFTLFVYLLLHRFLLKSGTDKTFHCGTPSCSLIDYAYSKPVSMTLLCCLLMKTSRTADNSLMIQSSVGRFLSKTTYASSKIYLIRIAGVSGFVSQFWNCEESGLPPFGRINLHPKGHYRNNVMPPMRQQASALISKN